MRVLSPEGSSSVKVVTSQSGDTIKTVGAYEENRFRGISLPIPPILPPGR